MGLCQGTGLDMQNPGRNEAAPCFSGQALAQGTLLCPPVHGSPDRGPKLHGWDKRQWKCWLL